MKTRWIVCLYISLILFGLTGYLWNRLQRTDRPVVAAAAAKPLIPCAFDLRSPANYYDRSISGNCGIPGDPPHPATCLDVKLSRRDRSTFEHLTYNRCDVEIPIAVLKVKFFNSKRERIGVSAVTAWNIAPHEVLHSAFEAPRAVWGEFRYVGLRAITNDPLDALR